jgi:NAD-dependent dihydropyrimidine dehydrogenase PreA subunit
VTFVITEACIDIKDKACLTECPVDCIYEGDRMTYIHPDQCIECGACEPLCPQEAIYYEPDLPSELAPYVAINATFFDGLDNPKSAKAIDVTGRDHPSVAAMPSRA